MCLCGTDHLCGERCSKAGFMSIGVKFSLAENGLLNKSRSLWSWGVRLRGDVSGKNQKLQVSDQIYLLGSPCKVYLSFFFESRVQLI